MSKRLTPKQESFCQKFIELGNASEAYRQSYNCERMKTSTINSRAKDLRKDGPITARIGELQAEHKERHKLTVDDLVIELEEARKVAKDEGAASAMVAATMGKAKILGFLTDKVDLSSSDGSMSPQAKPDYSGLTDDELRQYIALESKAASTTSGISKP